MIYVIVLTFQYLTGFSDIRLSSVEEHQELSYIKNIKDSFIQTFNASNYSNNGDLNKISKDIDFTKNFFKQELLKKGIIFDSKFILFSNGFETGLSYWTGSAVDSGCALGVTTARKYNGNYGLRAYADNNLGRRAWVYKEIAPLDTLYVRMYVQFDNIPHTDNYHVYSLIIDDNGNEVAYLYVDNSGGDNAFGVWDVANGLDYRWYTTLEPDRWYSVELKLVRGGSNGEIHLWIDGVERINQTNIDTNKDYGYDKIYVGNHYSSEASTNYIDCVAISNEYIGEECYPDEQPYFVFNLKTKELETKTEFPYEEYLFDGVLWLKFDEGSGNKAYDSSEYENNGFLYNIYPLDVLASNPSLEEPWSLDDNTDANHKIERPDQWIVGYYYDTSSKMLALRENNMVKDGDASIRMSITTDSSFWGEIQISDCDYLFPIDETEYLEGGNFQYYIKGDEPTYGDQTFIFCNASGYQLSRRWGDIDLDEDVGNGWRIKSSIWRPSSLGQGDGYIEKNAKYACFMQYFAYETKNVDREVVFDKFLIYQWDGLPTNEQRISRASSGWVDDKYGKALSFDGIDDYVKIDNVPVNTLPEANNTVMFWMYWNGGYYSDWNMPFSWSTEYDLGFNDQGCFGFNTGNGDNLGISSSGLANKWVHVAAIFYNGIPSSSTVSLYIDGTKQNIYDCLPNSHGSKSVTSTIFVSGWGSSQDYKFDGVIDEVKVWNRALTLSEIQREMNKG
jgi:hypothetical protein